MLYPEVFKSLERVRWNMATDVPWGDFDRAHLSDEQAATIKMNAITEWAALPATEMFLRDNLEDSDFSAFMSVWFFEEQKHSLVLIEYLRRFRPDLVPTEDELHVNRGLFPNDTVQSKLPDPQWLEHWLDAQIRFDKAWENRVVTMLLHNLSSLFECTFGSVSELNRYRKELASRGGELPQGA